MTALWHAQKRPWTAPRGTPSLMFMHLVLQQFPPTPSTLPPVWSRPPDWETSRSSRGASHMFASQVSLPLFSSQDFLCNQLEPEAKTVLEKT